jgi:hypothetical protein
MVEVANESLDTWDLLVIIMPYIIYKYFEEPTPLFSYSKLNTLASK